MKKVVFADNFWLDLKRLKKTDRLLIHLVGKKIELFKSNPDHPSLRKHKLEGNLKEYWSVSVNKSIRMVYVVVEDMCVFVKIGSHDQVYKKK